MILINATEESEAGVLPGEQLLIDMGNFNEELVKAGILLSGEGLRSSSQGKRVKFFGDDRQVVDGPFQETNLLVAGFWLWKVDTMEQAAEWVRRMPNPTGKRAEVEIRPIFAEDDFGEVFTPELRDQEARRRDQLYSK
jgi:hypothetical protein